MAVLPQPYGAFRSNSDNLMGAVESKLSIARNLKLPHNKAPGSYPLINQMA